MSKPREETRADIDRIFRIAKGDACVHCQRFPEEHADNRCLFEPTTYQHNTANAALWDACERMDKDLKYLDEIDKLLETVKPTFRVTA